MIAVRQTTLEPTELKHELERLLKEGEQLIRDAAEAIQMVGSGVDLVSVSYNKWKGELFSLKQLTTGVFDELDLTALIEADGIQTFPLSRRSIGLSRSDEEREEAIKRAKEIMGAAKIKNSKLREFIKKIGVLKVKVYVSRHRGIYLPHDGHCYPISKKRADIVWALKHGGLSGTSLCQDTNQKKPDLSNAIKEINRIFIKNLVVNHDLIITKPGYSLNIDHYDIEFVGDVSG